MTSSLACALLAVSLAALVWLAIADHRRSADTRRAIARLEETLRRTDARQAAVDALLRKPENAEVLERSLFLNSLLYRKAVSWSQLFADLEKILPYNVRIITIRPQVTSEQRVLLEMTVGAETTEPVVEFLMRLEASEVFGATTVYNSVPPSQSDPLIRFSVSVNYAQKL